MPEDVRMQLERILGHRDFEATERMRDFLRYVVEEKLAGRAHRLKGYTIAVEVFGRGKNFDANLDPIVRIQAGRLRRSLERYYLVAGGSDPIRIDIPKGGYVPTFTAQLPPAPSARDPASLDGAADLTADRPTIALQPFTDVTDDPGQAYFLNGLMEELIVELNRYEDVTCIQCRDVAPTGERDLPVQDVSRTVGARFLLGGSVRRDPASVKVSVHLTDAGSGRQLWADAYKLGLEAASLIDTQEEIARRVVGVIAGEYGVIARRLSRESKRKPPHELS
ncbi:MAG: hypothetical protein PVH40_08550, partial [Gemmatimonadales bacterium]